MKLLLVFRNKYKENEKKKTTKYSFRNALKYLNTSIRKINKKVFLYDKKLYIEKVKA